MFYAHSLDLLYPQRPPVNKELSPSAGDSRMQRRLSLKATWAQEAGLVRRPASNQQETLPSLQLFAGPPVRAFITVLTSMSR